MKENRKNCFWTRHPHRPLSRYGISQPKSISLDDYQVMFSTPQDPMTLGALRKMCEKWRCGNSTAEEWMNIVSELSKDEDRQFLELINRGKSLTEIFQKVLWERYNASSLPSKCMKSFPWCRIAQGVELPFWGSGSRLECENISHKELKDVAILLLRFHDLMIPIFKPHA